MANKRQSIIYVNFTPYENAGKILDYLLDNFEIVALITFGFHKFDKKGGTSKLKIFRDGNLVREQPLYQIPVPEKLLFLLLPLRSFLYLLQILFWVVLLRIKYGKFNIYFTVNAFTAWIGNLLRGLDLVEKTVFWVWDYYPPIHKSRVVMFMRWVYWQFDKSSLSSDKVAFLNKRLLNLRHFMGLITNIEPYAIVPIGTSLIKTHRKKIDSTLSLGFIGVIKKSQGLDFIFDNARLLLDNFGNIKLEIIGDGPEFEYFQKKSLNSQIQTTFHGLISEEKIDQVLSNCNIGIAPFVPEESNVSYYGDPSKIKKYLSFGLPVITTNVFLFSEEIAKEKAGVLINYFNPESLVRGISEIINNYDDYQKKAILLGEKYYYKKIYPDLFKDL